jgi:hypothetical protein
MARDGVGTKNEPALFRQIDCFEQTGGHSSARYNFFTVNDRDLEREQTQCMARK